MTEARPRTTDLNPLVEDAWRHHDAAVMLGVACADSMPILYFGDLRAYAASTIRVVTVGKNPSDQEFPRVRPSWRFASEPNEIGLRGLRGEPERYLGALDSYFRGRPYMDWFRHYEWVLDGLGVSYFGARNGTALHTDVCSPVATTPTWSKLSAEQQARLSGSGLPLWRQLIDVLAPHIVVASVRSSIVTQIVGNASGRPRRIAEFPTTGSGRVRKRPYDVEAMDISADRLLVTGPDAQTPFGTITSTQRRRVGRSVLAELLRRRRATASTSQITP